MTLTEFREMYGIKRIDFNKVRPTGHSNRWGTDRLICPYCRAEIEYDSEYIETILNGTKWQCGTCEKWFYAEGEVSIDTYCTPMADKVLENKRYIMGDYEHLDECEKRGVNFSENRYGNVEWRVFDKYTKPLIENGEME